MVCTLLRRMVVHKRLIEAGLIPQAPMHTASLVVLGYEDHSDTSSATAINPNPVRTAGSEEIELSDAEEGRSSAQQQKSKSGLKRRLSKVKHAGEKPAEGRDEFREKKEEVPVAVVEQRVSNLAQGCLCGLSHLLNSPLLIEQVWC